MAKVMKLQMTLGGIGGLNSAVTSLNKRLADTNTIFARLNRRIETLTNKLIELASAGNLVFPTGSGAGKGGKGGGASSDQFIGSMIFSAYSGQTQVMGAKVGAYLFRLGGGAAVAAIGIGSLVASAYALKGAFDTLQQWSTEGQTRIRAGIVNGGLDPNLINSIAAEFGMAVEDVADRASNIGLGGGNAFINQLKSLREMRGNWAQTKMFAEQFQLENYVGIQRMSNEQLTRMLGGLSSSVDKFSQDFFEYNRNLRELSYQFDTWKFNQVRGTNELMNDPWGYIGRSALGLFDALVTGIMEPIASLFGQDWADTSPIQKYLKSYDEKLSKASSDMSRAAESMADASKYLYNTSKSVEVRGGGGSQRAIPPGWMYAGNHVWMKQFAQDLGALSL